MKILIVSALFISFFQSCGIKGKPLPPLPQSQITEKQSSDSSKIKK